MKKYLILMLAAAIVCASLGAASASAAITVNNGKGIVLEFDSITRNSPSSGANAAITVESDDTFGTVHQYAYDGTLTNTNIQFTLNFVNTESAANGSYYYISFYYRFIDDDTYSLPNSFVRRPNVNNNSGQSSLGTLSAEWKKISFITTCTADIAASSNIQMRLIPFITAGTPICIQIAQPQCLYYGNVTSDGELAPEQVIEATLSKSKIEKIYIDGEGVETSEFPDEYFTEVLWETTELPKITADTYIEGLYDVSCDSQTLPAQYTVKSYALNYDITTGTGNTSEYKVAVDYKKAAAALEVNNASVSSDYTVSSGDKINISYQLYNYGNEADNCIIVLAFRNGNMFKDIITWKKTSEIGLTDDDCLYEVTDESLAGCEVSAYVIALDNMTVIN